MPTVRYPVSAVHKFDVMAWPHKPIMMLIEYNGVVYSGGYAVEGAGYQHLYYPAYNDSTGMIQVICIVNVFTGDAPAVNMNGLEIMVVDPILPAAPLEEVNQRIGVYPGYFVTLNAAGDVTFDSRYNYLKQSVSPNFSIGYAYGVNIGAGTDGVPAGNDLPLGYFIGKFTHNPPASSIWINPPVGNKLTLYAPVDAAGADNVPLDSNYAGKFADIYVNAVFVMSIQIMWGEDEVEKACYCKSVGIAPGVYTLIDGMHDESDTVEVRLPDLSALTSAWGAFFLVSTYSDALNIEASV
jgi:hypothetical protein